ncbi:hypothetical protein Bca4012_087528 [Brassica carinata]|uniref:Uncharacterized protein n=2 Tax=Brassica TaxID=3705 RepID=A0A8S9STS8_BRACR|nr:hypothetical protein F2Q69_00033592 [Brassica cretica]KAG2249139.1 hypothetical protein Bca52824_088767 [Brassica carinata]
MTTHLNGKSNQRHTLTLEHETLLTILSSQLAWNLYHFEHKEKNLYCRNFTSAEDLKLVRIPKKKEKLDVNSPPLKKKKRTRMILDGTPKLHQDALM